MDNMGENAGIQQGTVKEEIKYPSPADAQRLAQMLAEDRAQPYDLPTACSFRTEVMVGRLLEAGIPPGAVARVFQRLPEGETGRMYATDDGSDPGSFSRLLGLPPETSSGKYALPGTDATITFKNDGGVVVQDTAGEKGWHGKGYPLSEKNAPWVGENHITVGIYVRDPETNKVALQVIDPHLSKETPIMTAREWKDAVNCTASVVMAGRIGELAHILPETLSEQQREKFDAALKKHEGSRFGGNDRQKDNAVMQEMLNLDHIKQAEGVRNLSGITNWRFGELGAELEHPDKKEADGKRADSRITTDWDEMNPAQRKDLLQRWISELAPLREVQDKWHQKFPSGSPAPHRQAKAVATARLY